MNYIYEQIRAKSVSYLIAHTVSVSIYLRCPGYPMLAPRCHNALPPPQPRPAPPRPAPRPPGRVTRGQSQGSGVTEWSSGVVSVPLRFRKYPAKCSPRAPSSASTRTYRLRTNTTSTSKTSPTPSNSPSVETPTLTPATRTVTILFP